MITYRVMHIRNHRYHYCLHNLRHISVIRFLLVVALFDDVMMPKNLPLLYLTNAFTVLLYVVRLLLELIVL